MSSSNQRSYCRLRQSHRAKPRICTTCLQQPRQVKYELKQHKEAIADYDKAIELNPKDAQAYNNRGVAKKMLKQYKEAIADYDKAIELNPKYAEPTTIEA